MKLEKLWEGKLPSYWDITTWAALTEHFLIVCYRDLGTRKRMLEVFDLHHGASYKEDTVYNGLLGMIGTTVYPSLIVDARSHIQINRISSYDIISRSINWVAEEPALVEKYKIPQMTNSNFECYNLGNKQINLSCGQVSFRTQQQVRKPGWEIGNGMRLEQQGTELACLNSQDELLWTKRGYLGNWYHGVQGQRLYFMLPESHLVVIDRANGKELAGVNLKELKTVTGRVNGSFDFKNDRSFNNCTVADILIHEDLAVWVTECNQLATYDLHTGQLFISETMGEYDICLSTINNEYLLFYDIKNADYGSLLLAKVEELKHGANGSGTG